MGILDNVKEVENNILANKINDARLICVTKTVEKERIKEALDYGVKDVGENKVQELLDKYEFFKQYDDIKIHLIGSLQTNKVKYIIDKVDYIHSLDRISLAKEIDKRAKALGKTINCLVQINISMEESKHGLKEEEVFEFIKNVSEEYKNIKINGLMGMAPYVLEPEESRIYFKKLKSIFEDLKSKNLDNVDMKHLSMGMSNDYKIALQEGASLVRVGSNIFGRRIYN
ncbi:MAG: YggS family pyridoxal phosphate-dependent enzyme [Peptostreptococcaceae bacterium]|jgi:pyridoxal phosphate enzyme (YggS family)|nr:YggS family pyridoxal phosphate-dependent enzyme [Peptostreptococcaceae bacterium]